MKKHITFFLFFLPTLILTAQIGLEERGLLTHPGLGGFHNKIEGQAGIFETDTNLLPAESRSGDEIICIFAGGDTSIHCINPLYGPGSGQFSCLDCGEVSHGMAQMEGNCLLFIPPPTGFIFGQDTVSVEFCDTLGVCDTTTFHFAVSRRGMTSIESTTEIFAEASIELEADTSDLPTAFHTGWGIGCNNPVLSHFFGIKNIGYYEAKRFAGQDTACMILFDSYCVVDTVRFPITIHQDTLSITSGIFFDDFSYSGNYPAGDRWLDKHVYRNNTLGYEPPSVGMVSFDGLDQGGTPYGTDYGVSDYLTSIYLDTKDVNNKAYLSFWLQMKGYGLPTLDADSLVVEFRKADGSWVKVAGLPGNVNLDVDDLPPFEFYAIELSPEYQYRGFQFRFRNSSNNKGATSMWHLDYVQLRDGYTQEPQPSFADLAFVELPEPVIKPYSSMPWSHFQYNTDLAFIDSFDFAISNRFNTANSISGSGRIVLRSDAAGAPNLLPGGFTLADATNLEAGELLRGRRPIPVDIRNDILSNFEINFPADGPQTLLTEYNFVSGTGQAAVDDVVRNDTVVYATKFRDYFAYDDGTAERNLVTFKKGMMVAVKFTTSHPDTLRALSLHLQHAFSDLTAQVMNLHVWIGELDDEPEYSGEFLQPVYPDAFFDTLQGFTTYPLMDRFGIEPTPLFIPAGDFYIGWEQSSANNPGITVGFDKNRPEGKAFGYVYNTANWSAFTDYPETFFGSVMMRPIFSEEVPVFTANPTRALSDQSGFDVYPNPTEGQLHIVGLDPNSSYSFTVQNLLGMVCFRTEDAGSLDIGDLDNGFYLLTVFDADGKPLATRKVSLINGND